LNAAVESLVDTNDELPAGTFLNGGAFVIESTICNGGFGIVYRARSRMGKVFALKEFFVEGFSLRGTDMMVSSPDAYADELDELLMLFCEEGWWPGLMSHPNVMRVFDFFEENGTGYIVLEHIDGTDLQDIMEQNPDWLEPNQIMEIATILSDGLAYLHSNGVVHGDIAPDNVMMRGPFDPVLIDFGSAIFNDEGEQPQRPPVKMRAVKDGYSAPELYNRRLHPTSASDIYSLGATVHQMVMGVAPEPANLRLKQTNHNAIQLNSVHQYSPQFLSGISAALSLSRDERPSAEQFFRICSGVPR